MNEICVPIPCPRYSNLVSAARVFDMNQTRNGEWFFPKCVIRETYAGFAEDST